MTNTTYNPQATLTQNMDAYSTTDQWVWNTLFSRQATQLNQYAVSEYLQALEAMQPVLHPAAIPDFHQLDQWFASHTGWRIKVVPGLIPVEDFFQLLAQKRFCSSTWLRSPENLDYLEEPDMFHDVFGHIPLLAHPVFSEFIQSFGQLGLALLHRPEAVLMLKRLYWFTIEFGLMQQGNDLKVYGAGILSSYGETTVSVSDRVTHLPFDIHEILHRDFQTDQMQDAYYVIRSFDQLFHSLDIVRSVLL